MIITKIADHLNDLALLTSQVYQQSSAAMLIMDAHFNIVTINPAFIKKTGFTLAELQGLSVSIICDQMTSTGLRQEIQKKLAETNHFSGELPVIHKYGEHFSALGFIDGLPNNSGFIQHYLLLLVDISEQKQLESELRVSAEIDPLTQLGNRKLLFQSLENAIASAKRFNYKVALLFLDLDGFKQVNDYFGHGEGDKVLIEVAQRLRQCVRQVDTVARLGGDEFVVILNGTSQELIAVTAQRIIDFLTLSVKDQNFEMLVSVSIGISLYPQDSHNPLVLLQYSDEAMYKAKSKGKRQFCWHN